MARDFKFKKPEYKITNDGKSVQCYIPVVANDMRPFINLYYTGGGITISTEIKKAYDNVCRGGYGSTKYIAGDNMDVDFAKRLAYRKAVRNLHKKIVYFYKLLSKRVGLIYQQMKLMSDDYEEDVEVDNDVIERFIYENKEVVERMPEPQNGWIGRTNFGEWFIVIRQPDNNEYYTMVYEKGGFDKGALNESNANYDFDSNGICNIDNDSIDIFVKSNCFLNAATYVSRDENIIWRRKFEEKEV